MSLILFLFDCGHRVKNPKHKSRINKSKDFSLKNINFTCFDIFSIFWSNSLLLFSSMRTVFTIGSLIITDLATKSTDLQVSTNSWYVSERVCIPFDKSVDWIGVSLWPLNAWNFLEFSE